MAENQWLRLGGQGPAVNMALVVSVETTFDNDTLVLVVLHYAHKSVFYADDDARRILAWLKAHAELTPM